MITLPLDISRCAGRYDFDPDGEWCPDRHSCQRYLAWSEWDITAELPDYRGVPVSMAVPDCNHRIPLTNED